MIRKNILILFLLQNAFFDSGGWDDSGCETSVLNPNVARCHCDHMTNFAVLVSSYDPVSYLHKNIIYP